MEYSEVKEQIKQKLPVQKEFGDSENLLELGLSSIVIMRLVNQWRKQGVKVAFGTLMEHPTLKEWWKIIQKGTKKKGKKAKAEKRDIIMERDMRKPFPLTDVQYAYWVGREDNQVLGGIGCHAYLEFDGYGVVPERLQEAWSRIQYHHPMLRASFSENGMQKIESKPYSEKIKINDFSLLTETEAEQEAQAVRRRLSHRKLKIEETPQVWLDYQIQERQGALYLNWDYLQGLLDETQMESKIGVADKYKRFFRRWLKIFENENFIKEEQDGFCRTSKSWKVDVAAEWDYLWGVEKQLNYGEGFVRYLEKCSKSLTQLFRNEIAPLELLFPHGEMTTAVDTYQKTLSSKILRRHMML